MVFKSGVYQDNTKELKKFSVDELKQMVKEHPLGKGIKTSKLKKKELVELLNKIIEA